MDRNSVAWRGYWVAAPTPFQPDGTVDEPNWRALLQLYLRQGVHGVLVNGSTGEWFSQTDAERERVAEIAVEELRGRIPVVIGCSGYTPSDVAARGRHARSIGADGMLCTPPPYAVPTPREIVAFYGAVAAGVDLPLMVYNWARGTNVEITWQTALQLARIGTVVALKDSTANAAQAAETLKAVVDRVRVFGSYISRPGLATLHRVGGDGNIDGGGLGAPHAVAFYEAVWRDDAVAAEDAADAYVALMRQLIRPDWSGMFGSPAAQLKAAMALLGQPGGHVRPPLLPVDDPDDLVKLRTVLESAGLLVAAEP